MTKAQLYTFVTSQLSGIAMETSLFDTYLDIAQMRIENMRPWVILRKEDSSQTASTSNTFTTAKTIPSDFRKWYGNFPVVLTDLNNNPQGYREVPSSMKYAYKDAGNIFYCDYGSNALYLCGNITQSQTIHQFYIKKSTLVSADDANEWVFPTEYHAILGLHIAVFWKMGTDYDLISNSQASAQNQQATAIYEEMSRWDSDLQNSMQSGVDFPTTGQGWQAGQLPYEHFI